MQYKQKVHQLSQAGAPYDKYNYEKVKNVRNVNLNTYNKLITK